MRYFPSFLLSPPRSPPASISLDTRRPGKAKCRPTRSPSGRKLFGPHSSPRAGHGLREMCPEAHRLEPCGDSDQQSQGTPNTEFEPRVVASAPAVSAPPPGAFRGLVLVSMVCRKPGISRRYSFSSRISIPNLGAGPRGMDRKGQGLLLPQEPLDVTWYQQAIVGGRAAFLTGSESLLVTFASGFAGDPCTAIQRPRMTPVP